MRRAVFWLLFASCAARAADMSVGAPGVPPLPSGMVPASIVSTERPKMAMTALPRVSGSSIDLRFVPVSQVVDLVYAELLHVPYVIGPDVLQDTRPVSFRFDKANEDVRQFLSSFLDSLGYSVTERGGVAFVEKSRLSRDEAERVTFVYRPKYRNADYLSRIVAPLVHGQLTENRPVSLPEGSKSSSDAPATSAAGLMDQSTDTLVFVGSPRDVSVLKELLPQLDTAVDNVSVRAWVYEVTDAGENKSAFELALSLLGGRVGASVNVGSVLPSDNAIRLGVGSLHVALSALNNDSRFHVLTSPNLRVSSGGVASLNVGESVPVIGSVSYPSASGAPVQSIQYEDAGVIFKVRPTVKRDVIDLQLDEEISSFVNTTTGVNNSPTKNTRKVESTFGLVDGDVLLIGGLTQDQDINVNSGLSFLPRWMAGHTSSKSKSEILLLLQVKKI